MAETEDKKKDKKKRGLSENALNFASKLVSNTSQTATTPTGSPVDNPPKKIAERGQLDVVDQPSKEDFEYWQKQDNAGAYQSGNPLWYYDEDTSIDTKTGIQYKKEKKINVKRGDLGQPVFEEETTGGLVPVKSTDEQVSLPPTQSQIKSVEKQNKSEIVADKYEGDWRRETKKEDYASAMAVNFANVVQRYLKYTPLGHTFGLEGNAVATSLKSFSEPLFQALWQIDKGQEKIEQTKGIGDFAKAMGTLVLGMGHGAIAVMPEMATINAIYPHMEGAFTQGMTEVLGNEEQGRQWGQRLAHIASLGVFGKKVLLGGLESESFGSFMDKIVSSKNDEEMDELGGYDAVKELADEGDPEAQRLIRNSDNETLDQEWKALIVQFAHEIGFFGGMGAYKPQAKFFKRVVNAITPVSTKIRMLEKSVARMEREDVGRRKNYGEEGYTEKPELTQKKQILADIESLKQMRDQTIEQVKEIDQIEKTMTQLEADRQILSDKVDEAQVIEERMALIKQRDEVDAKIQEYRENVAKKESELPTVLLDEQPNAKADIETSKASADNAVKLIDQDLRILDQKMSQAKTRKELDEYEKEFTSLESRKKQWQERQEGYKQSGELVKPVEKPESKPKTEEATQDAGVTLKDMDTQLRDIERKYDSATDRERPTLETQYNELSSKKAELQKKQEEQEYQDAKILLKESIKPKPVGKDADGNPIYPTQQGIGINFTKDTFKALKVIGKYHAVRVARDYKKWSKAMIEEIGDRVKPFLRRIWEGVEADVLDEMKPREQHTPLSLRKDTKAQEQMMKVGKDVFARTKNWGEFRDEFEKLLGKDAVLTSNEVYRALQQGKDRLDGEMTLYHYTTRDEQRVSVDPKYVGKNEYTRGDLERSRRERFWTYVTNADENLIGRQTPVYATTVKSDKIYDLINDPEGRIANSRNYDSLIRKIAKDGYDGFYEHRNNIPMVQIFKETKMDRGGDMVGYISNALNSSPEYAELQKAWKDGDITKAEQLMNQIQGKSEQELDRLVRGNKSIVYNVVDSQTGVGMFGGGIEPSLIIRVKVPERESAQFREIMNEQGDKWGQLSVLYEAPMAKGEPMYEMMADGSQNVHKLEVKSNEIILKTQQGALIQKLAEESGFYGATVERGTVSILNLGDSYENFRSSSEKFVRKLEEAGLINKSEPVDSYISEVKTWSNDRDAKTGKIATYARDYSQDRITEKERQAVARELREGEIDQSRKELSDNELAKQKGKFKTEDDAFVESKEIKKLEKEGKVDRFYDPANLNGKEVLVMSPDNKVVASVSFLKGLITKGMGGMYFPLQKIKELLGAFWAVGSQSKGTSMVNAMNSLLKRSPDGIGRMMLFTGTETKHLNSTEGMMMTLRTLGQLITEGTLPKSVFRKALHKANTKFGMEIDGRKKTEDVLSEIDSKLTIDFTSQNKQRQTFEKRKLYIETVLKQIVKDEKTMTQHQRDKMRRELGVDKGGNVLGVRTIKDAVARATTEPELRGETANKAYAVLEFTSPVELVSKDHHPSYPFIIRQTNGEMPTIRILSERPYYDQILTNKEGKRWTEYATEMGLNERYGTAWAGLANTGGGVTPSLVKYEGAKKSLQEKLNRANMTFGLDTLPELYTIGKYHISNGIKTLAEFTKKMVQEVGTKIKPFARKLWNELTKDRTGLDNVVKMGIGGKEKPQGVDTTPEVKKRVAEVIDGFYVPAEKKILDTKLEKRSAQSWLTSGMFSKEEGNWLGITDYLKSKKPNEQIHRDELLGLIKENRPEIEVRRYEDESPDYYYGQEVEWATDREFSRLHDEIAEAKGEISYAENLKSELEKKLDEAQDKMIEIGDDPQRAVEYERWEKRYEATKEHIEEHEANIKEWEGSQREAESQLRRLEEYGLDDGALQEIRESVGDDRNTNYSDYITSGEVGKYSEIVVIANPNSRIGEFQNPHSFPDNAVVHIRVSERPDSKGKTTLFIDEVQSDWGERGRKKGFTNEKATEGLYNKIKKLEEKRFELSQEISPENPSASFGKVQEANSAREIKADQRRYLAYWTKDMFTRDSHEGMLRNLNDIKGAKVVVVKNQDRHGYWGVEVRKSNGEVWQRWSQSFADEGRAEFVAEGLRSELPFIAKQLEGMWDAYNRHTTPMLSPEDTFALPQFEKDRLKIVARLSVWTGGTKLSDPNMQKLHDISAEIEVLQRQQREEMFGKVADAPFVKDTNKWVKLGLQYALKEAVDRGLDKVAWTTGEQQRDIEGYGLAEQVSKIRIIKSSKGSNPATYHLHFTKEADSFETRYEKDGISEWADAKEFYDVIGKERTEALLKQIEKQESKQESIPFYETRRTYSELKGKNMIMGGEGMKKFYGSVKNQNIGMVGKVMQSLVGENSVKITKMKMDKKKPTEQYSIEITPELQKKVEEGLPMEMSIMPKIKVPERVKSLFRSRGELDQKTFNLLEEDKARARATEVRIGYLTKDLRKTLRDDYGSKGFRDTELHRNMDDYLHGIDNGTIKPNVKKILDEMRADLDSRSLELMDTPVLSATLREKVGDNLGTYLTRFYERDYNNKWTKYIYETEQGQKILNNAREMMKKEYEKQGITKTDEQIEGELYDITRPAEDFMSANLKGSEARLNRDTLEPRKDMPEWRRELMGEIHDPVANFVRSVIKTADMVSKHTLQSQMRDNGLGTIFFEDRTKNEQGAFTELLASGDNPAWKSLTQGRDIYTTKEIKESLENFFSPSANPETIGQHIVQKYQMAMGFIRLGKTALSPTTTARNIMSNPVLMLVNGYYNFHQLPRNMVLDRARREKLTRLGVIGTSSSRGELHDAMSDIMRTSSRTDSLKKTVVQRAGSLIDKPSEFYGSIDDWFKGMAFDAEMKRYTKNYKEDLANGTMKIEDLEKEVADIISRVTTNYGRVAPIIKDYIRRLPVGNFVSFPAEMIRLSKEIPKQAIKEMQNPKTRSIGMKRMMSFLGTMSAISATPMMFKAISGVSEEEELAMREFMPEWQRNSQFAHFGKEDNTYRLLDLSYTDPFNYVRKPIIAMLTADPQKDNPAKVMGEVLRETLAPFLSEEILAQIVLDIYSGKDNDTGKEIYNKEDTNWNIMMNSLEYALNKSAPSFIKQFSNLEKGYREEQTPYKKYTLKDEALGFAGQRITTIDPAVAFGFRASDLSKELAEISRMGSSAQWKYVDDDTRLQKRLDEVDVIFNNKLNTFRQLIDAGRTLGLDDSRMKQMLKLGRVSGANIELLFSDKVGSLKEKSEKSKEKEDKRRDRINNQSGTSPQRQTTTPQTQSSERRRIRR